MLMSPSLLTFGRIGFHGAAKIFTDGTYANSDSSTAIWFTNLDCGGSEASLLHCSMTKDGNTTCTHSQDVGLTCNSLVRIERAENYYTLAPTPEPTSTDLVGTVKIWHGVNGVNRTWTTVPSIDRYNGAVICKHLSQGATEPFSYVSTSNSRDTISSSADLFTCDGTEGLVDECSSSSSPPSSTPSPALWAPIIRCSRSLTLATAVDEATDEPTGRLFRKFALDAAEFSSSIDSNATGLALVKEFVALLPRYRGIRPILTTPSSASSNAAVASLLVGSSEQAFISLLDTLKNGTWTWVGGDQDGELVYDASGAADGSATYTNWKPPAPSTTDSTGCATIGADGEWSAVDCSLNFPSVVVTYPVDTLEALTSHVTCASNGLVLACPASEQYMTVRSVFAGFDETDHIICSSSAVFTPRASASASLPSSSNSCQIGPAAVKAFIESICFESGALSRTCTISDGQLQAFLASQGACGSTEVELSRVYISVNFECTSAGGAGPVARYIHGDSRYHDTNVPTTPVLTRFGSEDWVGDCDGTVLLSAHGTLAWETLNYGDEDAAEVSSSSGASPSFWTGTAASGGQVTQADNTAQSIFMMITPYENDFYEADLLCMDAQVPSTSSSEAPVLTSRLYLDLQNRLCYEGTLNTATNSSTIMPAYNQVEQTMWVDEEAHTQHICGIHTARTGVWEAAALVREGECVRILLIGVRGKGVVASGCGFQSFSLNDVQRMQLLTRYKGLAFRLSIYDQTLSDGELSFLASSDRERCRSLDYHCPKGMEAYGGSVPEGPVDSTGKRLCTPCRSASINGQTTQLQPSCVTCDCIYLMDCRGRGDAENLYAIFTTYGTGGNSKESCYNSAALIISEGPMVAVFVVGGMWIMTFFVYIILPILCGWDMGDINVMSLMMSLPIFDAILYMVDGVYLFYWLEGIDVLEHKRQMPPVTLQKGVTLIVLGAVQMVVCLLITFGHKGLIENHPGRMRYIFWVSRIALVNAAVVFLLHATELMSGQVSKESTLWDQGIDTGIVFDVGKWDALRLLTARLVLGYTGVLCVIYSVNFWYEENTLKRIIRQKETTDMEAYLEIHGYRIRSRQALETFVMGLYGQTKHEKGVSKHTNNLQKLLVQDPLYDAHLAGLVCSFILPSIKTTDHVMTEDELLELERMQRHHHLDMRGNKLEYLQFSLREYKKMRAQDHPLLRETEEGKAESKKDKQAKAEAMRPIQATLSFRRMLSFGEDDYR